MTFEINAYLREKKGKEVGKKLRREGKIPGIVYGRHEESRKIWVQEKELLALLTKVARRIPIVELTIAETNEKFSAILKAIQKNPINEKYLHVDFQKIHLDEKIVVSCPIILTGTALGAKMGGLLDHRLHTVLIRGCLRDLPPYIEVDVSNLRLGRSIHLKDVKIEGVEFMLPEDTTIVSVLAPKRIEEIKPITEEVKMPEVIKEKKEKEEPEE